MISSRLSAVDGIPRPAQLSSTLTQLISSPASIRCNFSLAVLQSDDDPSRRRYAFSSVFAAVFINMATLPRRQSGNRLPEYKDYVNFVSAYRNGKKDEDADNGQPIVLTINSGISSRDPGTKTGGKICESYSEFLGKTKNKRFGSVKPPISNRESINFPAKKTVKTEIFLEINNDPVEENGSCQTDAYSVGKTIRKFENHNGQHKELTRTQSSSSVEAKKKLFENKSTPKNQPVTAKVSSHNSVQISKTDLQHVLNGSANLSSEDLPNKDIISANKKIFEHTNKEIHESADKITHIIPVTIFIKKNDDISSITRISNDSSSLDITRKFLVQERERIMNDDLGENGINPNSMEIQKESQSREKLIQQLTKTMSKAELLEVRENKINEEKTNNVNCAPTTDEVVNSVSPPPPPPMPVCFNQITAKITRISPTLIQKQSNEKDQHHVIQKNISLQSENAVDGQVLSNNRKYSTVDRKDPLVRKLAYGAMLDMYGAYHDKANNYVAALPQHQVKKDNGLQKIIDNIAAQGGLEKLSGRSNPKADNE